MKKKKIGFILAPKKRLTGALLQNREVFQYLKNKGLSVEKLIPKTYQYYNIPLLGVLLNYFTLYSKKEGFEYYFATSIAGAPFLEKNKKLISMFHCLDSTSATKVLDNLNNENAVDKKNRKYWMPKLKKKLMPLTSDIETRETINKVIEEACLAGAEAAICVSPFVKKEIEKKFKKLPKRKIQVILNGVPNYFFKPKRINNQINRHNLNIVFISRITKREYTTYVKGLDRLLGIYSKNYKNLNKVLIAYFTEYEKIKSFWQNILKTNQVDLISNLSRHEIASCLRKGDIYLQTSRSEACQLTLLESMASGLVPVTYPVGVAPLFIKNNKTGFLVNSITEAIDRINYLIKHPDKRMEMSNNCIAVAEKNFRYQRMMDEYYNFFKKL